LTRSLVALAVSTLISFPARSAGLTTCEFHSRNATAAQIKAADDASKFLNKDDPMKADSINQERAQRRKETLQDTAFRHMVEICEGLPDTDGAAPTCQAAISYYRIISDVKCPSP
jgi:hypothetical protein